MSVADTETKGGILRIISKGVKVDIFNSDFRRCTVYGRNMVYIGWNGDDSVYSGIKIIKITDTFFTGCNSLIPGMRIINNDTIVLVDKVVPNSETNIF